MVTQNATYKLVCVSFYPSHIICLLTESDDPSGNAMYRLCLDNVLVPRSAVIAVEFLFSISFPFTIPIDTPNEQPITISHSKEFLFIFCVFVCSFFRLIFRWIITLNPKLSTQIQSQSQSHFFFIYLQKKESKIIIMQTLEPPKLKK